MNHRIAKCVNGSVIHFQQDRENAWADAEVNGVSVARYLLGDRIDQMLVRQRLNESVDWYFTDNLDTVRGLAESSGSLLTTISYTSFGQPVDLVPIQFAGRFHFTGRDFDSETGLSFNRSRFYAPESGRFIRVDPIGLASTDLNLYRYVWNSPNTAVDPYGEQASLEYALQVSINTFIFTCNMFLAEDLQLESYKNILEFALGTLNSLPLPVSLYLKFSPVIGAIECGHALAKWKLGIHPR